MNQTSVLIVVLIVVVMEQKNLPLLNLVHLLVQYPKLTEDLLQMIGPIIQKMKILQLKKVYLLMKRQPKILLERRFEQMKEMLSFTKRICILMFFSPIEEEKGLDYKFMVAVLTEYIRSLNFNHIKVEPFLHEMLINFLVRNNRFYQLHQLLQYHVVSDSVHVACQLLSLENTYAPAYQLALDMMKRLHTHEEILEVLLTKQQLTAALRFIRTHRGIKGVSSKRFLEAAMISGDVILFYTVYKFFEQRRDLNDCAKYVDHFKLTFEKNSKISK